MSERDQREFAGRVLTPLWEQSVKDRLESGLISPTIEGKLMDYKYGKPVERREVIVRGSLEGLSLEELSIRSKRISDRLAKALERERQEVGGVKLLEAGDIQDAEIVERRTTPEGETCPDCNKVVGPLSHIKGQCS